MPPEKSWRRGYDAMGSLNAASMSDPAQQFRLNQQMARFLNDHNDDA